MAHGDAELPNQATRQGLMQNSIRRCMPVDYPEILSIINEAAEAYRGVIPADRWHDPYMSMTDLQRDVDAGMVLWGCETDGALIGVMGVQPVQDVALIRHAYVRTGRQRSGTGAALMEHLRAQTDRRILVGTWAAASWAIRFYERNGFSLVAPAEAAALLRRYWSIPERQIETSVVLEG